MKKFLLILCVILFTGCNKQVVHYEKFSNTVVGLFDSVVYDQKGFNQTEIKLIEKYITTLTHENEIIELDKYIQKNEDYYTDEKNTQGVFTDNGKCYIKYEDINFEKIPNDNSHLADSQVAKIICNNYLVILNDSHFTSYEEIRNNKRHNYRYLGHSKDMNVYNFVYRSYYDGMGLIVTIETDGNNIVKFDVKEDNTNNYVLVTEEEGSAFGAIILYLAILGLVGSLVVFVFKKIKR